MEWMTIDTAPRDGTEILLGNAEDGTVEAGYWYTAEPHCWQVLGAIALKDAFTHWMPFPEPPAKREKVA